MNTEPTSFTTTKFYIGCFTQIGMDLEVSNGAVPIYSKEINDTAVCHSKGMYEKRAMISMHNSVTNMCTLYGVVPLVLTPNAEWAKKSQWTTQIWRSSEPCSGGGENKAKGIYTLTTGESFQMIRESDNSIKLTPVV
ncbi:unnamed protein product [Caenorhabditis brenneri]